MKATGQTVATAATTFTALAILLEFAGDFIAFWYVLVREIVYLRASLYPLTALLLAGVAIGIFAFLSSQGLSPARAAITLICGGFAAGGILYLVEAFARVGTLLRGQVWFGAGLAALTVSAWMGVSVLMWMLSYACVGWLVRGARRRVAAGA